MPAKSTNLALCFVLSTILSTCCFAKDYLVITSDPPGAKVEIDGDVVGRTPYRIEIPHQYLHGTGNVFGLKHVLAQQMHLRLILEGYLPKEEDLARGPFKWIALNGTYHGDYFLLKAATFNFALEIAATNFTGNIAASLSGSGPATLSAAVSTEEIFRRSNPAVLLLRGSDGTGSGFLLTDTGVAATNAHVARGQSLLTATTGNGQTFNAKVEYIDPDLDIALIKLEGANFAHLPLAEATTIQTGSSVIAIGNPSQGFQNSLTKGVVSAMGPMPREKGIWIQTDAAINPGNSGGPLLNSAGEVVGINTQKPFVSGDGRPLQGIGFALSSTDLLSVLTRFYPNISRSPQPALADAPNGKGKVAISADVENAEIYVDGNFVGNAPSTLTLQEGSHKIEVKSSSGTWGRDLHVLGDSNVILRATLPRTDSEGEKK
jgi:S1-C subfamily serine protease